MARGDLVQTLELPATPDGNVDIRALNNILRQMQDRVFALEGRTQPSRILDTLTVDGSITADGALSGENLTLGNCAFIPTNPSLSPTVDAALTPQALTWNPSVGGSVDLLSPFSPFTWTLKDEFFGGNGLSGTTGDLGWTLVGGSVGFPGAQPGHQGVISLDTGVGPAVVRILLDTVNVDDVVYLAAVVRVGDVIDAGYRVGVLSSPGAGSENSQGFYFSYDSSRSSFWRTVTSGLSGALVNTTGVEVLPNAWYVLEIVVSPDPTNRPVVDFYINRTRAFRHQNLVVSSGFPAVVCEDLGGSGRSFTVDRFLISGRPRTRIWT